MKNHEINFDLSLQRDAYRSRNPRKVIRNILPESTIKDRYLKRHLLVYLKGYWIADENSSNVLRYKFFFRPRRIMMPFSLVYLYLGTFILGGIGSLKNLWRECLMPETYGLIVTETFKTDDSNIEFVYDIFDDDRGD